MIKVLNIIGKRPVGGIGAFVYNYQSHFIEGVIECDYLLFDDSPSGPFDERVKALGSNVYVLPALKNSRIFIIWKRIFEFFKMIGYRYDIIHLHSVNIAFMCFPIAKRFGIKALVAHSHATVYSDKPLNAVRNKILCKNLLKQATNYCACSIAAGRFLYGDDNIHNVTVFNNAVDCQKFQFNDLIRQDVRKELGLSKKFVIGNVGRFCEQKNQLFLLDVFYECRRIQDNAFLLLVGDGPQIEQAKDKAKKLGLDNDVLFLGYRNDVEKLLQAMDIFVLPSLFEGLPVIGIEAQVSGLQMVVSDTITTELDLIGVEFVSLDADICEWAKCVLSYKSRYERKKCWEVVTDLGYDINHESKRLVEYYLKLVDM